MQSKTSTAFLSIVLLSAGTSSTMFVPACGREAGAASAGQSTGVPTERHEARDEVALADKSLAAFQIELLDLASKAATAIPVKLHLKDRSRAQEAVAGTCLELDQPTLALGCIEEIRNWRRGTGYADIAYYRAQHGDASQAQRLLSLARKVADTPPDDDSQDWQRDRIQAKIAQTLVFLEENQQATQLEAGVQASEAGHVAVARAKHADASTFDDQVKALDAAIVTGSFDHVRNAQDTCVQLWNRFYEDEDRRSILEARIENSSSKVPATFRVEVLMRLATAALEHKDQGKALELVTRAQLFLDGARLTAEAQVPLIARLAALRFEAGDRENAQTEATRALEVFAAGRDEIPNVFRAGVLRPIAEAYQRMGDLATARAVYLKVVEEGVDTLNSRPRAEDLSATCCSMALHGVEPDAALRSRLLDVLKGLGQPW